MRRFTRLTNGFSRKVDNHKAALALSFMHYNSARIHKTLRVTPALEAGKADHVWSLEEIAGLEVSGMHILVVAIMVLAGLHAGCAREVYYHPAYTPELWARDSYECGRGAGEHGYFGKGAAGGWPIRDFYDRCLVGRGWTKTQESNSN